MESYSIRNRYYEEHPGEIPGAGKLRPGRTIPVSDQVIQRLKKITYMKFMNQTGMTSQTYYSLLSGRECFGGTYQKILDLLADGETPPPFEKERE